jgi:hypothetical protein
MTDRFFGYRIDRRFLPFCLLFGFRPSRDGVRVTDDEFLATFGLFKMRMPRSNVTEAHVTRNYRWWTAVGVRTSHVDDGLTFGTNRDGGVCIHFDNKVPSPLRHRGHSALTVTVGELDALAELLNRETA